MARRETMLIHTDGKDDYHFHITSAGEPYTTWFK